ncbi:anthrax toxin-like adenylyl cyclase domain-containing protein [Vibrio sp. 10N.261.55.A7]|uniref:anthrax toxin-like adenylyl cyclase domain-containing protein n=1 Tax=Vibrio sp. 10N.261.55.A7 TaxID=1880851 RepID=UPI000C829381|nr:anthrax toxin-like adenylyl cyclase domain-containing protein [Vibrio sp. 10N.261.55.A7]PMJ92122.1 hypothetical protein BCU12_08370 [Vibrio sp. 10N.261.55.A7]
MKYGLGLVEQDMGIPIEHCTAFQTVARDTNTVIATRSVGVYATELIREGYASKGYHVKAKSCDWGPMAGFVLADPSLGKKGLGNEALVWQYKKIEDAIHCGARVIPLFISEQRRNNLKRLVGFNKVYIESRLGTGLNYFNIEAGTHGGLYQFILVRASELINPVGHPNASSWAVCYKDNSPFLLNCSPARRHLVTTRSGETFHQVCALSNPEGNSAGAPVNFKAAQTGDYDLWGVFPPNQSPLTGGEERSVMSVLHRNGELRPSFHARHVPGSDSYIRTYQEFEQREDRHLGNVSLLIEEIAVRLNARFGRNGNGGWMVHHSDEAGRPMVDEIDCDAVVFAPSGLVLILETIEDVRELRFNLILEGYRPLFNPIWNFKLGVDRDRIARDWRQRGNLANKFPLAEHRHYPGL